MKSFNPLFAGLISLVLLSAHQARTVPFDEAADSLAVEGAKPLPSLTTLPAAGGPLDEYALALAKASNINLLLDATQIDPNARTFPYPTAQEPYAIQKTPTFLGVMDDFLRSCKLAQLRYDLNTYLVWNGPTREQVAALILANKEAAPLLPPNERQFFQDLGRDYKRLVTPDNQPEDSSVLWSGPITQLSPASQRGIAALARYNIVHPDYRQELALTDEFWKTARVRLGRGTPQDGLIQKFPSLYVIGQNEKGQRLPAFDLALGSLDIDVNDEALFETVRQATYSPPLNADRTVAQVNTPPDLRTPVLRLANPEAPALGWDALELQKGLKTKISLEIKRRPLGEVLQEVGKQSGFKLVLGEDALGTPERPTLLTARIKEMPLATFMGAVARVYAVTWTQTAGREYVVRASALSPLEKLLLQAGSGYIYNGTTEWKLSAEREEEAGNLRQQVLDEVNSPELGALMGVPVSALSPDLQRQLRVLYTQRMLGRFTWSRFIADTGLAPNCIVRLSGVQPPVGLDPVFGQADLPPGTRLLLLNASGAASLMKIRLYSQGDDAEVALPLVGRTEVPPQQ